MRVRIIKELNDGKILKKDGSSQLKPVLLEHSYNATIIHKQLNIIITA